MEYFRGETIDRKQAFALVDAIDKAVVEAIDKLQVVKNSVEYTFGSSMRASLNKYFEGVVKNPKEQARFQRDTDKRNAVIAKGKTPDWEVVPAALVDLELCKKGIRDVLHNLRHSIQNELDTVASFDPEAKMVELTYIQERLAEE